jgi:hypothetical protein
MLLDTSHWKWGLGTAAVAVVAGGLYLLADRGLSGGFTSGSGLGLGFGVAGMGLMVYAGLLSAHRRVPRWSWPGPRSVWLRGHIWMGTLSLWFVLLHSGFHRGGPLEQALWVVLALTLLTGAYGLALQNIVPRRLLARGPDEVPVGQHAHVCGLLRQQAHEALAVLCPSGPGNSAVDVTLSARDCLQTLDKSEVPLFFSVPYPRRSRLSNVRNARAMFAELRRQPWSEAERGELARLETCCEQRRSLGEQERLHRHLHVWLPFHILLSVALLVLGAIHAVASLLY